MQITCIYCKQPYAQVTCAPCCFLRMGAAHLHCPHDQHQLEREEGRMRNINLLFYPSMQSLVDSCMVLTGNQTHNLGILGRCSNQLNYLARAHLFYFDCEVHNDPTAFTFPATRRVEVEGTTIPIVDTTETCKSYPLTSHWLEFSHMGTPS